MSKIYLEVVTSKYISGTSMRDKSSELVPLNIDFPSNFSSSTSIFEETNNCIIEVIKKYAEENDVVLGIEYNNAMVGTNMYQDQKFSKVVFIEREEDGYFRKAFIENNTSISFIHLNWWSFSNEYWKIDGNRSYVAKRRSSF